MRSTVLLGKGCFKRKVHLPLQLDQKQDTGNWGERRRESFLGAYGI